MEMKVSYVFRSLFFVMPLVVCLVLVAGCAVGPDYAAPDLEMPQAWYGKNSEPEPEQYVKTTEMSNWWILLNDPDLKQLIDQSLYGNITLKEAYYRIVVAQAQKQYAQGEYFPRIDMQTGYTRSRASQNTSLKRTGQEAEPMDTYSAGLGTSWELDLFGRIRRSVESADASLDASKEACNDIMVSLTSSVASSYIELRTLQERIAFAKKNIDLQQETLKLTVARFDSELVPELDVEQAKLNLANTQAAISSLQKAESEVFNRLAVLLGGFPHGLRARITEGAPIPEISPEIPKIVPLEIIRQRPDIRLAERQLAAQTARIGIAKTGFYPVASFKGSFFLEGTEPSDLKDISSRRYSFGPQFDWNIFEGGRTLSNVRIESAKTEQVKLQYEQTVLSAVEEVENALAFYSEEKKRYEALQQSAESSQKSVELVSSLYRSGLTDFQNVLDMQRTLFKSQDELANSKGQIIQDWIRIYKAFGGGWPMDAGRKE
ncbi:MAG: efflux transporter outer membrane subunit [Candidatus Auribacterota bacterium]|jgi:NodT family efflux transporter outer membrane factor (OMF) lipoprotein|nr:efflux transporter outer membrane subunit [Candidatus Auribacterota bacterium]